MGLFDFFKKNTSVEQTVPTTTPTEVVPSTTAQTVSPITETEAQLSSLSWQERLRAGLSKTRNLLNRDIRALFATHQLGPKELEELETLLLSADIGVAATQHLIQDLQQQWLRTGGKEAPLALLQQSLLDLLTPLEKPLQIGETRPYIIMVAGVNGAGKTTSIGKLAKWLTQQGYSVLLAAGDTFRAAACEQLQAWGAANNITVIAQQNGDPAAVVFDAIQAAKARKIDIVIADTAGRLPTQLHLMQELMKVKRVIQKADPAAPQEILLVLDANTGQNSLEQVKAFHQAIELTGLVMTKLDGTAKGGVVAALAKTYPIPLKFIGVGEGIDDLRTFRASEYVTAILE